ncbi:MAG: response regulator [bacterium]|nr:response regulator [bacterium]
MATPNERPVGQKWVLIVDDTAVVRHFVSKIFTEAGHKAIQAENGKVGLELARSTDPDLIILDVMMPIMGGIETLRALREDAQFESTPIVMLTGEHERETVIKVLMEGVTDYIVKDSLSNIKERRKQYVEAL